MQATITGWGKYLPAKEVLNTDLETLVETTDEWIRSRTGIIARRIASGSESTSTMCIAAARDALAVAGLTGQDIDLVIVATCTPDNILSATACLVQHALHIRGGAFDLGAACSGFMYALVTGAQFIMTGVYRRVLIVGADTMSRILNWKDRSTCILFGDGAGAVVLEATKANAGLRSFVLGSQGSGENLLTVPAGGSRNPASIDTVTQQLHALKMNGPEVFKFAVRVMNQSLEEILAKAGLAVCDLDLFIPHQANIRIILAALKHLNLPTDRVVINLERYGNTSAGSVPIALCEAIEAGRVHPGDNIAMIGFGGGLTWGAALMTWG